MSTVIGDLSDPNILIPFPIEHSTTASKYTLLRFGGYCVCQLPKRFYYLLYDWSIIIQSSVLLQTKCFLYCLFLHRMLLNMVSGLPPGVNGKYYFIYLLMCNLARMRIRMHSHS